MKNKRSPSGFSISFFLAFLVALFLLFTPFEESGTRATMLPKYLAAGVAMVAMSPLVFLGKIRVKLPSLLVATLLFTLVFTWSSSSRCHRNSSS